MSDESVVDLLIRSALSLDPPWKIAGVRADPASRRMDVLLGVDDSGCALCGRVGQPERSERRIRWFRHQGICGYRVFVGYPEDIPVCETGGCGLGVPLEYERSHIGARAAKNIQALAGVVGPDPDLISKFTGIDRVLIDASGILAGLAGPVSTPPVPHDRKVPPSPVSADAGSAAADKTMLVSAPASASADSPSGERDAGESSQPEPTHAAGGDETQVLRVAEPEQAKPVEVPDIPDRAWEMLARGEIRLQTRVTALQMLLNKARMLSVNENGLRLAIDELRRFFEINRSRLGSELEDLRDLPETEPERSGDARTAGDAEESVAALVQEVPAATDPLWEQMLDAKWTPAGAPLPFRLLLQAKRRQAIASPERRLQAIEDLRAWFQARPHMLSLLPPDKTTVVSRQVAGGTGTLTGGQLPVVPPEDHAVWGRILRGEVTLGIRDLSYNLMLKNLQSRCQARGWREEDLMEGIRKLREYFSRPANIAKTTAITRVDPAACKVAG